MKWIKWSEKIPDNWESKINRQITTGIVLNNSDWAHRNDRLNEDSDNAHCDFIFYKDLEWLDESPSTETGQQGVEYDHPGDKPIVQPVEYYKKKHYHSSHPFANWEEEYNHDCLLLERWEENYALYLKSQPQEGQDELWDELREDIYRHRKTFKECSSKFTLIKK